MELAWPSMDHLPHVADALRRGWSPDNVRGEAAAREELARIESDAAAYVDSLVDRAAIRQGETVLVIAGWPTIGPLLFGGWFGDAIAVLPQHDVLGHLREVKPA